MNSFQRRKLWMIIGLTALALTILVLLQEHALSLQSQKAGAHIAVLNPVVLRSLLEPDDNMFPDAMLNETRPHLFPSTVHYLWCSNRDSKFRFKDYLSILSVIKIVKPMKLVFHYNSLPVEDDYNTWFSMVSQTPPGLTLEKLPFLGATCGSEAMLDHLLTFLAPRGGVFVGQRVILARAPAQAHVKPFSFHFANSPIKTQGVVFAAHGFNDEATRLNHVREILSASPTCMSDKTYDVSRNRDAVCVIFNDSLLYPKDIMFSKGRFSELARWLFYGKAEPVMVQKDPENLIPRISHFIKLKGSSSDYGSDLAFVHFISILSALYVAGFQHVYLHSDVRPSGPWWDELQKESVTHVFVENFEAVYSQQIDRLQHKSDVLRFQTLYKYGGAYQDMDVVWTSRVNDSLLACPYVLALDWPKQGEWPETINDGLMLARPHSRWARLYLETLKDYRDNLWAYNSGLMSYRMYEFYPHLACKEPRLEVLCYKGLCHPAWDEHFVRDFYDDRPTVPFKLTDMNAIHINAPKPIPSLVSPQTLRKGTDDLAIACRELLRRSGRAHLLRD